MALVDVTFGNDDSKVSDHLKCWVVQFDEQSAIRTMVIGVIGEGTSRSIQSNWTSPFEGNSLGGFLATAANIGQVGTGRTTITTFSSTQVWEGNRPHTFNLALKFYALRNAEKEVAGALKALEMMLAPNIDARDRSDDRGYIQRIQDARGFRETVGAILEPARDATPFGRIPYPVMLNIGPRMTIPDCVVESMSADLSMERTKQGLPVRAEVNLTIQTRVMLNRKTTGETWY